MSRAARTPRAPGRPAPGVPGPRVARLLLVLGGAVLPLLAAVPAAGGPSSAAPRAVVLGQGRALAVALPQDDGGTPGDARLTADAVNGRACASASGVRRTVTGLLLSADVTGTRRALADGSLAGCVTLAPTVAKDLLAHPETYSLVVTRADAGEVRGSLLGAAPATRPYAVGTRAETLVDRGRATARRGRVRPAAGRTLRVTYYYPAGGPAAAGEQAEAEPSLEGPFPVVLFAHGYAATPQSYARTLHAWAEAGYVVAAPLFPGSGGGLPGPPSEADLSQQPRDLRVVLDAVTAHRRDSGSWLGGVADVSRVAVAGHSDGGSTAAAAGLLAGYIDRRYDATIVMAGARFPGTTAGRTPPLLLLSGERDEYNEPSIFATVFATARGPRTWVQAVRAGHGEPFTGTGAQADTLRRLEIAFLDRWLLGADTRASEHAAAAVPGLTRVRAGGF